tara:strand:- start:470 stop:667 length:198 start_codon:yes stop_codon:yes gene_type:complete
MNKTSFQNLPIGTEFLWGGYTQNSMNWGRKRSSRTADYRPNLNGQLSDFMGWGYFGQNETVFLAD